MEIKRLGYVDDRAFIQLSLQGHSEAINLPRVANIFTVLISSIQDGSVQLEYSLSAEDDVIGDSAIWHITSLGSKSNNTGIAFDSPVKFIRCRSSKTTTRYVLEVLG